MAPRWPGPKPTVGSDPLEGIFDGFTGNIVDYVITLIANAVIQALRGVPIVGGTLGDIVAELSGLNGRTDAAQSTADGIQAGIVDGFNGSASVGADQQVYDTMAALKEMAGGDGWTRVNVTSTGSWTVPAGVKEIVLVGIAAGENGQTGYQIASNNNDGYGDGGAFGRGGGHRVQAIDPAGISAIHITVGTNGAPTVFRRDNSTGAVLAQAVVGAPGSMATTFGYTASASSAGNGGVGGGGGANGPEKPGANGSSSGAATGGNGGATRSAGSDGASVGSSDVPCGGGGGGGGGGSTSTTGGRGGNGGFPGGGGGGGGTCSTSIIGQTPGAGGTGGAGSGTIYYR